MLQGFSPSTQHTDGNNYMSGPTDMHTQGLNNHNTALSPEVYHYRSSYPQADLVQFSQLRSNDTITLFIEGQSGALSIIHPKRLKEKVEQKINGHAAIDSIKTTKQGKILVITRSIDTAVQVLQFTSLAGILVTPPVQI